MYLLRAGLTPRRALPIHVKEAGELASYDHHNEMHIYISSSGIGGLYTRWRRGKCDGIQERRVLRS